VSIEEGGALISIAAVNDSTFELEHVLKTEPALSPSTTYIARVSSTDNANNLASSSIVFTTVPTEPQTSPFPSPSPLPPPQPSPPLESPEGPITWSPPSGGEPSGGYRIDIFDSAYNLQTQIFVSADYRGIPTPDLATGDYVAVIYANDDGVFRKVGEPIAFSVRPKSFLERFYIVVPYIAAGIGAILIIIWFVLKRSRKPELPAAERSIGTKR
jgi:hypothetical protein